MLPFEIVSADIIGLDDEQLRAVLRLLVEAEAKKHGIPLNSIQLGGHQNAKDGGVDARLEWVGKPDRTEWCPQSLSVFQSKAESMPRSKLLREMAPKGKPRVMFTELAQKGGAYIVFSSDDCSPGMYTDRISAMNDAIAGVPSGGRINCEFYDASRIARWVNCFEGVAGRVRDMIGRPMIGWRPYENWSAPTVSISAEYLVDKDPKLTFISESNKQVPIVEAIDKVRSELSKPQSVVRLIGISGVGKTRFAQALFDERIGQDALDCGLVVYGDLSQSPSTVASQVAEQLVHKQNPAVMIVDNCPGETHRAISFIVNRPSSRTSLLTIDFDVSRDQPQDTWVVRLSRNEDQLIETLLTTRVPELAVLDRNRVVGFVDGNARAALTIANAESGSGSLADLSDQQLIDRLFLDGRRPTDDTLRRCAEVASLVYAFHVDQEKNQEPEHPVLAQLAEVSPNQMYRAIAEFVERGTAQKRGTQRAILPEALAIKLAIQALERLPSESALDHFNRKGKERLFQSFTRRLGFLHRSQHACRVAGVLIGPDGLLGDLANLSRYGVTLFQNVAPAAPEAALAAIERAVQGPKGQEFVSLDAPFRWEIAAVTRNLAYERDRFNRAAQVLLAFSKEEPEDHNNNAVRPHFLELFWIGLSWTQALPEQRYAFIDELYANGDDIEKILAVEALDHALTTGHIASHHDGRFGSRPMGKEWRPKIIHEQDNWYREALNRLVSIACEDGNLAEKARTAIAHEFRGLVHAGLIDDLSLAIEIIAKKGYWPQGWTLFCEALNFDREDWPPVVQARAAQLEHKLRPKSLEDRFAAYVTSEPWRFYLVEGPSQDGEERSIFELAKEIGEEAAQLPEVWPSLFQMACEFQGENSCHAFGCGLATGAAEISQMWERLLTIFESINPESRNAAVLSGFLNAANDREPDKVQQWLDEAAVHDLLAPYIVGLSINLPIDRCAITRLTTVVQSSRAATQSFRGLAYGRATEATPTAELVEFLRTLMAADTSGADVAVDILHMHLFGLKDGGKIDSRLLEFGRELLQFTNVYVGASRNHTHGLEEIAKKCLVGREDSEVVRKICQLLLDLQNSNRRTFFELRNFVGVLANLHLETVLEVVLQNDSNARLLGEELFGYADETEEKNGTCSVNTNIEILIKWINTEPTTRAVRVAQFVRYHEENNKEGTVSWSPVARALMNLPGVGPEVLEEFYSRFGSGAGWGPWSNRFVRRRPLLEELTTHSDEAIRKWAKSSLAKLDAYIGTQVEEERIRDERFE